MLKHSYFIYIFLLRHPVAHFPPEFWKRNMGGGTQRCTSLRHSSLLFGVWTKRNIEFHYPTRNVLRNPWKVKRTGPDVTLWERNILTLSEWSQVHSAYPDTQEIR